MSEPTATEVLGMLANEWDKEAERIFWNIPDDSTPENVTLSLTQLSEAYTLKNCAEELRAALAAPAPVEAEKRVKAFAIACRQMSEELSGTRAWFEEAIKRIGHLPDAPSRMADVLLNMGYETADSMFLEKYDAALNPEATP